MSNMSSPAPSPNDDVASIIPHFMYISGITTVTLATALVYLIMKRGKSDVKQIEEDEETNVVDRSEYPGGHLSIFFASQTGTAEAFAKQLEREAAENGFFAHVLDLEDYQLDQLIDEARRDEEDGGVNKTIFLCSTYGEGEPTDNAAAFVQEIKGYLDEGETESTPLLNDVLKGLEYCVFGLGNTQYEHYNAMGKLFDTALEKFGGVRVAKLGLGDDDNDLEGDFEAWTSNVLWPALKKRYVKEGATRMNHKSSNATMPETPFAVEFVKSGTQSMSMDKVHSANRHFFDSVDCPVKVVRELRSKDADGSTVHVEVDISKAPNLTYQTADNLGVLPVNSSDIVKQVASALKYDLDASFVVKASPKHEWHGAPFPMPITVRELLTRYCDVTGSLRRSDLKLLSLYAKEPVDQKALLRMSSKEGKAEFKEKIQDAHVGLVDLLKLCPSIEAPLEHFINFCPHMIPRYYTISSSSSVHPTNIHLTVSVTETKKKDGTIYMGLCSSHLAGSKGQQIRVFNRDSTFRLPADSTKPILMIGPGTGIAPMRALLQEREHQKVKRKQRVGKGVLYFGCKKRSEDFLYQDELAKFQKAGVLTDLYLAFSREQSEKIYVQHLLAKNAAESWELVHKEGASIYVCGGVKMGADVSAALKDIAVSQGQMSATDAKSYFDKLAGEGRFVQELWA